MMKEWIFAMNWYEECNIEIDDVLHIKSDLIEREWTECDSVHNREDIGKWVQDLIVIRMFLRKNYGIVMIRTRKRLNNSELNQIKRLNRGQ